MLLAAAFCSPNHDSAPSQPPPSDTESAVALAPRRRSDSLAALRPVKISGEGGQPAGSRLPLDLLAIDPRTSVPRVLCANLAALSTHPYKSPMKPVAFFNNKGGVGKISRSIISRCFLSSQRMDLSAPCQCRQRLLPRFPSTSSYHCSAHGIAVIVIALMTHFENIIPAK